MNDKNVFEMMGPYERNHVPLVVKNYIIHYIPSTNT